MILKFLSSCAVIATFTSASAIAAEIPAPDKNTDDNREVIKPLNANQREAVRVIATQVLAGKRAEKNSSSEGAAISNHFASIRQQILAEQKIKNAAAIPLAEAETNMPASEQGKMKSLRDISSKMKVLQDTHYANDEAHVRGLERADILKKNEEIQLELDDALSADPVERSMRLQHLAERLTPRRLSEDNDRISLQPALTTISKHRSDN